MNKDLIIIFTKNPVLGKCKTRLASTLGDELALKIYLQLLEHTKTFTSKLECDKHVYFSQEIPEDSLWDSHSFDHRTQSQGDLGKKMKDAFEDSFNEGYQNVVIIGSDCAEINEKDLTLAFEALQNKDAVIGPAIDGGYYLLGMNSFMPYLFNDKSWSTPQLLDETITSLIENGNSYELLEKKSDIDYEEDLNRPSYVDFDYS